MEPPPAPPLTTTTAAATTESVDSSPRSRNTDSWDESYQPTFPKLRLMCSFGGHIVPRPHDKSLCYIGGDTRIIVVDRHSSLSDLSHRLSKTLLNNNHNFTLKYQLPNEDLDSLISVTTDEDLDNMIDEYDRLSNNNSTKSSRLRLFLFPLKPESVSSIGSLLENSTKSEDWFLSALNGTNSGLSDSNSVNCLLGLDDDVVISNNPKLSGSINKNQDVHSVPDSPMLETSSSFGSASSSPSLANLPPIRVHAVEYQQKMGIEEQFSHMVVSGNLNQKSDEGGSVGLSSPPPTVLAASGVPMNYAPVIGEYSNRVFSDDERSEQGGVSMGYRKQLQQQTQSVPLQWHQKPTGLDLASPDSVSSDGSITNPLSRQKHMIYQDPIVQIPSEHNRVSANPVEPRITDPNIRVQMQQRQFQDSGYILPAQYDPRQLQQQQQQPQFIHSGAQYIQHHPTGAVPMASYYPIYPSQQPHHPHHPVLDHQYPVYYVPARQAQAFNMAVQQPGYSEAAVSAPSNRPQTPPPSAMATPAAAYNTARNAPPPKPDMAAGVYRTANTAAPSLVHIPSSQHQPQYVDFSQSHHPSQSIAPTSAATANYAYEFMDPTQAHMYYTQPLAPQMAAQYQTMTSALPEATAHLTTDSIKQQVRTSQP